MTDEEIALLNSEIQRLRKSIDELKKIPGMDLGRCQTYLSLATSLTRSKSYDKAKKYLALAQKELNEKVPQSVVFSKRIETIKELLDKVDKIAPEITKQSKECIQKAEKALQEKEEEKVRKLIESAEESLAIECARYAKEQVVAFNSLIGRASKHEIQTEDAEKAIAILDSSLSSPVNELVDALVECRSQIDKIKKKLDLKMSSVVEQAEKEEELSESGENPELQETIRQVASELSKVRSLGADVTEVDYLYNEAKSAFRKKKFVKAAELLESCKSELKDIREQFEKAKQKAALQALMKAQSVVTNAKAAGVVTEETEATLKRAMDAFEEKDYQQTCDIAGQAEYLAKKSMQDSEMLKEKMDEIKKKLERAKGAGLEVSTAEKFISMSKLDECRKEEREGTQKADKAYTCIICRGAIKPGLRFIKCVCGKAFHDSCGSRLGECPSCQRKILEVTRTVYDVAFDYLKKAEEILDRNLADYDTTNEMVTQARILYTLSEKRNLLEGNEKELMKETETMFSSGKYRDTREKVEKLISRITPKLQKSVEEEIANVENFIERARNSGIIQESGKEIIEHAKKFIGSNDLESAADAIQKVRIDTEKSWRSVIQNTLENISKMMKDAEELEARIEDGKLLYDRANEFLGANDYENAHKQAKLAEEEVKHTVRQKLSEKIEIYSARLQFLDEQTIKEKELREKIQLAKEAMLNLEYERAKRLVRDVENVISVPSKPQHPIRADVMPVTQINAKAQRGLVNGNGFTNGLTNGKGFTNGKTKKVSMRKRTQMEMKRKMAVAALTVVLILAVPIITYKIMSEKTKIAIDGDFSDWETVPKYYDGIKEECKSNVNIEKYAVREHDSAVYFYVKTKGNTFDVGNNGVGQLRVLFSTGLEKGVLYEGEKVSYRIDIQGWDKEVKSASLSKYNESREDGDVNAFEYFSAISARAVRNEVEFAFPANLMNFANTKFMFIMQDSERSYDLTQWCMVGKGSLIIEQHFCADNYTTTQNFEPLRLFITSPEKEMTITGLEFLRLGTNSAPCMIEISRTNSQSTIFTCNFAAEKKSIASGNLKIGKGESVELVVRASVTELTGTLGFMLSSGNGVLVENGYVTLRNITEPGKGKVTSLTQVFDGIKIDGSFYDWSFVSSNVDDEIVNNPNIDIDTYKHYNDTETLSFYLSVKGVVFKDNGLVSNLARHVASNESEKVTLPFEPQRDRAIVFIDTDGISNSGMRIYDGPRVVMYADWMLVVSGREGIIEESKYYKYLGNSWVYSGNILSASGDKEIEMQISRTAISSSIYSICYSMTSWDKTTDTTNKLDFGTDVRDSGSRYYHGRQQINLSSDVYSIVSPLPSDIVCSLAADMDNDGDDDIVYVDDNKATYVLYNPGGNCLKTTWSLMQIGPAEGAPILQIRAADLDADGLIDIIYSIDRGNNNLVGYRNAGMGMWPKSTLTVLPNRPRGIAIADFDLDGALDIAVTTDVGRVYACRNPGFSLAFSTSWSSFLLNNTNLNQMASVIEACDLNHDGLADLATGDNAGDLYIWKNPGKGLAFSSEWLKTKPMSKSTSEIHGLGIADFDNNGSMDICLLEANGASNTITILKNPYPLDPFSGILWDMKNLALGLKTRTSTNRNHIDISLKDFDNDGWIDVAIPEYDNRYVKVYENPIISPFTTSWSLSVSYSSSSSPSGVIASDFDHDGDNDLCFYDNNRRLYSMNNTLIHRNMPFADAINAGLGVEDGFCSMKSCDFDNDGDYDVVTLQYPNTYHEQRIMIWQNPNNYSVTCWTTWTNQCVANMVDISSVGDLSIGDMNNDGWVDIVYAGRNFTYEVYGITVFKNDGTPWNDEWQSKQHTINGNAYPNKACVSDIDLDGDLDVISSLSDGRIFGWMNWGDPFIATMSSYLLVDISSYLYSMSIENLDTSLYPDLIVCDSSGDILIYKNEGNPWNPWTTSRIVGNAGSQVIALATCDYNLDGGMDIISGDQGGSNQIDIWLSPGRNLSFTADWTFRDSFSSPGYLVASLSCADLDNDGDFDFAAGDADGYILIHRNPLIGPEDWFQVGRIDGCVYGLALVNLDRKNAYDNLNADIGDIDIIACGSGGSSQGTVSIFENIGASANITVEDMALSVLMAGMPYPLLRLTIRHNGIYPDNGIEIQELRFQYRNGDDTGNLTSSDISNLFNTHMLCLDDGDGIWEGLGLEITVGSTYSISGNIVSIIPTSEPTSATISATSSRIYYYVVITKSPLPITTFRVRFDPDGINSTNGWTQIEDLASDKITTIEPSSSFVTKKIWTVVPEFEEYALPVVFVITVTLLLKRKKGKNEKLLGKK